MKVIRNIVGNIFFVEYIWIIVVLFRIGGVIDFILNWKDGDRGVCGISGDWVGVRVDYGEKN